MRITKYWIFQGIGWFLFAFLNIYIAAITKELSLPIFLLDILLSISGLWLTHGYRTYILNKRWVDKSTESLLKHVFFAILLLSLLYTIIYFIMTRLVLPSSVLQVDFSNIFGTFMAIFVLFSIWNAIYFTWNYVEKNRQLLIQQLTMESELKDLEIKTIKANLQPHFIFNALNSIRALIDEDPVRAREAVTKISNILRSSIAKKEEADTLENEINLVEDYLALEKIRFEERLQFDKHIAPEVLPIKIPTMMLQTLIENAIKHGIAAHESGGIIKLEAFLNNQLLTIKIKNTGLLNPQTIHQDSLSFGLNASKQRLGHLYPGKSSLKIEQENDLVVTTITIHTN